MFKLSKLESKYPCYHCGHREMRHGKYLGKPVCWKCHDELNDLNVLHAFKPDNLKYLEMQTNPLTSR